MRVCGLVEDEHQRSSRFRTSCSQFHRRSLWNNDMRAASAANHGALRGFEAGFAAWMVPGLRTGVTMHPRLHARTEDGFHELGRVGGARLCRERADFRDIRCAPAVRHPASAIESSHTLSNASTTVPRPVFAFSAATSRECLQMPEGRRALERTQWLRRRGRSTRKRARHVRWSERKRLPG